MHHLKWRNSMVLDRSYSLFWSENDPRVDFDPVIKLIKECSLSITNIVYHKETPVTNNRCSITFTLTGIIQNIELFELKCYQNPELAQFYDSDLSEEPH